MAANRPPESDHQICLKSADRIHRLRLDEIECVMAADENSLVITRQEVLAILESFGSLRRRLPTSHFVQIHRSMVVSLCQIVELSPKSHGDYRIKLGSGRMAVLTRTRRKGVLSQLENSLFRPILNPRTVQISTARIQPIPQATSGLSRDPGHSSRPSPENSMPE